MSERMSELGDRGERVEGVALGDALDVLTRFGAALLRAGDTAHRVRELMGALARSMGLEPPSVSLTLNSITAGIRRGSEQATLLREIGPPAVNASRIVALEAIARAAAPGLRAADLAGQLAAAEATPGRYSVALIAAAVGAGCGCFAFLNGGGPLEIVGAAIGGGLGQWLRARLIHRGLNQHAVTAVCAVAAAATCAVIAFVSSRLGFGTAGHPAGLISSILFLVPGFPLVAGLLDLLQYQTLAALTRFAYSAMIVLAAAFGFSLVVGLAGFDVASQPPLEMSASLKLLLRAVASFIGGWGFAVLFNSPARAALVVGVLSLVSNDLRLVLRDAGMMAAPAAFIGALTVGFLASLVASRLDVPPLALAVPGIIIMVPGIPAFQMIVLFNRGEMLEALQAASVCGFVTGALGIGLATARVLTEGWRRSAR
jgi:uncharacterized membrane protein YjjP (DUF1212 family)